MKYRSQWPTFLFRSTIGSNWLIKPKYSVHISNSLQDIRQNHWTMKYRSQWPTFILRSIVGSCWLIILKYDVYTSNSLQNIKLCRSVPGTRTRSRTWMLTTEVITIALLVLRTGELITNFYVQQPTQGTFSNGTQQLIEPHHEQTCLRGFRPGKAQTSLLNYRDKLEAGDFAHRNYKYYTI